MPRLLRIKLAGIPQHLVQRGVNREPCFFAEEDYHCYLHWLFEAAADWRCSVHAYVLMTNHVHLLVTPEMSDGLAKLMQSVGRRYVQYVNRIYKRSGTLWEGRFKSSVVQTEEYLLLCQRYIELNPGRAGSLDNYLDHHPLLCHRKIHRAHRPRRLQAQKLFIQSSVFHADSIDKKSDSIADPATCGKLDMSLG